MVELAFAGGDVTASKYTPGDPADPAIRAVLIRGIDGDSTFDWWFPRAQLQASRDINLQRIQETRVPIELGILYATPDRFSMQTDHPAWTGTLTPLSVEVESRSSKAAA